MSNDDYRSPLKEETAEKELSIRNENSLEANESQASNGSTLISLLEEVLVEKKYPAHSNDPDASNQLFYDNQYRMLQVQDDFPNFSSNFIPVNAESSAPINLQQFPNLSSNPRVAPPNVHCDIYQYHLIQQQIQQQNQLLQRQEGAYDVTPESYLYQQQEIFNEMQLQNLYLQQVIHEKMDPTEIQASESKLETKESPDENIEPPTNFERLNIVEWLSSGYRQTSSMALDKEKKVCLSGKKSNSLDKSSKKSQDSNEDTTPVHKDFTKIHPKIKDFTLEKWLVEKLDVCSHVSIDKPSPAQYAHSGMFTESTPNIQQLWISRYAPPLESMPSTISNGPASRFRKSNVTEKFEIWDKGPVHVRDMNVSVVPRRVLELSKTADSIKPPILSVEMTKKCRHCIDQRLRDNYLEKLLHLAKEFFLKDFTHMHKGLSRETNEKALVVEYDLVNLTFFNVEIKPKEGPYKDGVFNFQIAVSYSFPVKPPLVRCLTPIEHPNIKDGEISCNLLTTWNKSSELLEVIKGLIRLLENPTIDETIDQTNTNKESSDLNKHDSITSKATTITEEFERLRNQSYKDKHTSILEKQVTRESKINFKLHKKSKYSFTTAQDYNTDLFEELYHRSLIESTLSEREELDVAAHLQHLSKRDNLLHELLLLNKSSDEDMLEDIPKELFIAKNSDVGHIVLSSLELPAEFHKDDCKASMMIFSRDENDLGVMRPLVISNSRDNVLLIYPLENHLIRFTLIIENYIRKYQRIFDRIVTYDQNLRYDLSPIIITLEVLFESIKQGSQYFNIGKYMPYVRSNIPQLSKNILEFYFPDST